MFKRSPKRVAASIIKRTSSVCGFHTSTNLPTRPFSTPPQSTVSGPTRISRLFSKSIKTSFLVDQLGVSLALPVPVPLAGISDIAILTLSAALRFRTDLTPLGFGLDTTRIKPRMLIEEKPRNVEAKIHADHADAASSDGGNHPLDGVPGPSVPPPAYSKVDRPPSSGQDVTYGGSEPNADGSPPPAANFVHVYRRDGRVSGRWNIDPNMSVPAVFLPASDGDARAGPLAYFGVTKSDKKAEEQKEGPTPNLKLHTRDGRIVADVSITSSQVNVTNTKPTLFDLYTRDGAIILRVRDHGPAPLHLKLYTHDGSIRVFLPRTFRGMLTHELRCGSIIASPEIQKQGGITTFTSIDGGVGRSFVGEWRGLLNSAGVSGKEKNAEAPLPTEEEEWTGDHCEVTSRDGNAYFYWEDEYDEVMYRLTAKGWIKSLFSP